MPVNTLNNEKTDSAKLLDTISQTLVAANQLSP